MKTYTEYKRILKQKIPPLHEIKLAVLGDFSTQKLCDMLKAVGHENKIKISLYEADFDSIDAEIFNPQSNLYHFEPNYVFISTASKKQQLKFNSLELPQKVEFANNYLEKATQWWQTLNQNIKTNIIFSNLIETDDAVFGNYANKTSYSWLYQVRKINFMLMDKAQEYKNVFIQDMSVLHNNLGKQKVFKPSLYYTANQVYDIDFLPYISKSVVDIILAIEGKFRKCLILDLDNTLWGGIIGDDGLENIQIGDIGIGKSFTDLQYYAKKLKERGIILCVCSKNDELIAKEPFEKHPDMVLSLKDIAVFVANWENKADNIRYIQSILEIGFDSMVFLDDNPFERNLIRTQLPEICVPELPDDPAEYVNYLESLNLFETASFTQDDTARTEMYQTEDTRRKAQANYSSIDEYLKSLNMAAEVGDFSNSFYVPRIAQITQRSNQFNLRTIRYTEADIQRLAQDKNYATFYFCLEDTFGSYGLISVVILEKQENLTLFVDTWLMSCRVLKRGVEQFVLNTIVEYAKSNGFKHIIGEYIPTAKNGMVKDHYPKLGFEAMHKPNFWRLDVDNFVFYPVYIQRHMEKAFS
ncbi:MAG: HAD-IIIC family phosphatase [Bacteroidia bacterium]|nr:HAD-IIIC family phosphatase [Bacteroidia bacterium]MDW8347155.1 HAD-IIIC family phosphatase [Bacteroidia bacterium]